jgi:hypothetical protein
VAQVTQLPNGPTTSPDLPASPVAVPDLRERWPTSFIEVITYDWAIDTSTWPASWAG